jgi:hypothetical protein
MSQRLSLFSAGFCANAPALYYQQRDLAGQYELLADAGLHRKMDEFFAKLELNENNQTDFLKSATEIAREFEVDAPAIPQNADEYFEWLPAFVNEVEKSFPMNRIDHYYFLFGRKISEIVVNSAFACCCLDLQVALGNGLDLSRKTDKCIKDNEYILFKLIAPAALLSSEPRQNFFNVFYRSINAAFEPFRGIEAGELNETEMCKLSDDLRLYEKEVMKGYRDCETQLRSLAF